MMHHDLTNFGAGDFFVFSAENVSLYSIDHGFQLFTGDGAFVAGTTDTVDQFVSLLAQSVNGMDNTASTKTL